MAEEYTYRFMQKGDEYEISELISGIFTKEIAPLFSREGIRRFMAYVSPQSILARTGEGHFTIIAEQSGKICGVILVRSYSHISLLFVAEGHRENGVAGQLIAQAVKICTDQSPGLGEITVNASPNSVFIYRRLGFTDRGPEEEKDGFRFTPMTRKLS